MGSPISAVIARSASCCLALCACIVPSAALAANPLNSSEKADAAASSPSPGGKLDFTIVPVAGGSTDVGLGGGFFAGLTKNQAGYDPFVWNVEAAWFVTFAVDSSRRLTIPYNDGYGKLTITRFLGAPLQFDLRPSFTDEGILYYYGMGNASAVAHSQASDRSFQYGRVHPSILTNLSFKIVDHVAGKVGIRYTASSLSVVPGSKLAEDASNGSAEVKRLIGSTAGLQSVALFQYGIQFDTRDNETSPHAGTWDEAVVKASPGGSGAFPYRYGQGTVILRVYVPASSHVTLAARVVGDVLYGDVPFVELPRFEDTYAVGGATGVRGVPAQRYYGKMKAFGNLELRARLFDFHLFGKPMTMGAVCFGDGGRVWADTTRHPELDGTGLDIKYGVGAGLRLMSSTAFVLRGDVAWSPDATPIGGYVSAGEMF
jgi:hypothetical protein